MKLKHIYISVTVAVLAGCAIGQTTPQTPAQFRAGVAKGMSGTEHETYLARGSYRSVVARIRRKANECLNDHTFVVKTCYYEANCTLHHYTLHSHFSEHRNGSELVVQMKSNAVVNIGGKAPKDGNFIAVSDITPARHGRAMVSTYGLRAAWLKLIPSTLKHWADDTNLGCPDLTADM